MAATDPAANAQPSTTMNPPPPKRQRTRRRARSKKVSATSKAVDDVERQLTLTEIRAAKTSWLANFPHDPKTGRKIKQNARVKAAAWETYKSGQIKYAGRKMNKTFEAEYKLMRRHTNPLEYFRYRSGLTRNFPTNARTALTEEQFDFYIECGGTANVNDLVTKQSNVSSLTQAEPSVQRSNRKRAHSQLQSSSITAASSVAVGNSIALDDATMLAMLTASVNSIPPPLGPPTFRPNHNGGPHTSSMTATTTTMPTAMTIGTSVDGALSMAPSTLANGSQNVLKAEKCEHFDQRYAALLQLQAGLTVAEEEKLAKRKWDVYEMSKQRLRALESHTRDILRTSPELIGTVLMGAMPVTEQRTMLFDVWLTDNRVLIKGLVQDPEEFLYAYKRLHSRDDAWNDFTLEFKACLMWYPLAFGPVWELIQRVFAPFALKACSSDKQELDEDGDDDDGEQ